MSPAPDAALAHLPMPASDPAATPRAPIHRPTAEKIPAIGRHKASTTQKSIPPPSSFPHWVPDGPQRNSAFRAQHSPARWERRPRPREEIRASVPVKVLPPSRARLCRKPRRKSWKNLSVQPGCRCNEEAFRSAAASAALLRGYRWQRGFLGKCGEQIASDPPWLNRRQSLSWLSTRRDSTYSEAAVP